MTPTPDPRAVLAEAWHRYLAATAPGAFTAEQLMGDAGGILAALSAEGYTVALAAQPTPPLDVLTLAAIIRGVDGKHDLGASALAEAILAALSEPKS